MMRRRKSKPINIGNVIVGGGAPIVIQSMAKTDTRDAKATIRQIKQLERCGCQLVRVAIPDREAAEALPAIKKAIRIPLVADIHFDHRLALQAIDAGVDGLRLNPGNIRDPQHIKRVVLAARERNVPIRIGVNAGSLPPTNDTTKSTVERMVEASMSEIDLLESLDFGLIKVSLKAFDVSETIEANRTIAKRMPYPIHLGITESGTPRRGAIRSAIGIGIMLWEGIGDTIRVSLTADPREEVNAGYEILKSLGLSQRGPTLISCPTCGRTEIDVVTLANAVEKQLAKIEKSIKVAVMGCVVNGPGEARNADVGIACGKGKGIIFSKGKQVRTVNESEFLSALMTEIEKF
ncbi:MAG: flavodoxin-dependent (E)-4-hydroxy-3-methylbut-2-enyl-diphosphate synthase [Dehalococcoidia bacterium]|jgi:(E)-4-hydroxy-3-methylbut-2-enyl-diphosphate synthase